MRKRLGGFMICMAFQRSFYEYRYEAKGSLRLTERVMEITEGIVEADNSWGIDHGG